MARAHCAVTTYDPTTNTVLTAATVNVYTPGTVTPIGATIFDKNGNPLSNPLTSDAATGLVDFYLSVAQEVDLVVSKSSFTTRTYSNVPVLDDASNNLTALLTTTGQIPFAVSANVPSALAIGSANQVLIVSGGVPAWSGSLTLSGTLTVSSLAAFNGSLTAGGGTLAATGVVRIANANTIAWRNGANSNDDSITFDSSDQLNLVCRASASTATAGSSGALPAQVQEYVWVVVNGNTRKIPAYLT